MTMRLMDSFKEIKNLYARRRGAVTRDGHELSERDSDTVHDTYQAFICLLMDLNILDLVVHRAAVGRVMSELLRHDIIVPLKALADVYEMIQRNDRCIARFKAAFSFSPTLYSCMEPTIKSHIEGNIPASCRLLQIGAFMSRLSLQDIDLTEQSIGDYLKSEELISEVYPSSIVKALNRIIRFWCRDFDASDIQFKHGNGAVAFLESKTLENKYRALGSDRMIDIVFRDVYEPNVQTMLSSGRDIPIKIDRVSETTFVPKSWKAMRTISMESPTLMYLQQGVLRAIDRMVESSTYLRNRIGTHEQERNVRKAKEGSLWRNYATIDLSAASDSVPWALVKQVFRGTPLYPYLIATRSKETLLPDGKLVQLKKYAPMGSALCFPIETMLFASICELVTRRWHHVSGETRSYLGDFTVYGDDIICPTECAEDIISVLGMFSFRVNSGKSFFKSEDWYRESCGGEFIEGFDVTPLRLSRKFSSAYQTEFVKAQESTLETGDGVIGYVDAYNKCFEKGFLLLRCFFKDKLDQHGFVPFFGHGGLRGFNETNFHLKKKVIDTVTVARNRNFQLDRFYCSDFVPFKKDIDRQRGNEEIAYRFWLEQAYYRQVNSVSQPAPPVIRWVPIQGKGQPRKVVPLTIDRTSVIVAEVGPPARRNMKKVWKALPRE